MAAAFDDIRNFYGQYHHFLRECAEQIRGVDSLYSHADGYGRQCGRTGQRYHHPRLVIGRDRVCRLEQSGVEGDQDGGALRSDAGGLQFREAALL